VTWDQFGAVVLGLGATALVRLLDRWLPPSHDDHSVAATAVEVQRRVPPPDEEVT